MKDPRFSIVIPTRERAETLRYCLRTCLEQQEFTDYEIVVSDNNSSPATKQLVDSFGSEKIRYFSTGKTLAMYENFEFAVSKAQGEYVIVLGDDDGMLLKGLHYLDKIIQQTNYKAVAWNWIFYYWPEGVPYGVENIMHIPVSCDVKVVNSRERLKDVAAFRMPYNQLPMLYINAAIHRDLINELRQKTGKIFDSVIPDVYSAMCFGFLSKQFLFLDRPLSIAAISGKSTGNHVFNKRSNSEINKEFKTLNNASEANSITAVPEIRSMNALVSGVFLRAKAALFPDDENLVIDRKEMIVKSLEDVIAFNSEEWEDSMNNIRDTVRHDEDLSVWLENQLRELEPKITDTSKKQEIVTGLHHNMLIVDGATFQCKNVYDVAVFYNRFFESDIYVPKELDFKEQQIIEKPNKSLITKLYRRIKFAGRILMKGY